MLRSYCAIFFIQCIFLNICLGELTTEKKQDFLNGFIESLNNEPDKPYIYEEGVFVDAQKLDEDNNYKITVRLKVSDIHDIDAVKILKCSISVVDGNNGLVVQHGHQCAEDPDGSVGDGQDSVDTGSTESPVEGITGPVQLVNEVQSDAEVTSGERFVAIPRPSAPCIGCATHVDPTAAGVPEMAHLGIRHLDLHDPGAKHALKSVVEVERQVQVVNGVRYILTLLVDFNNCTVPPAEPCPVSTPCKISILEKPWKKLPDGSKYRAIVANNCTAEWLFGDDGEVLPSERNNENNELYPDSSGNFDDDLRVVHNFDTQAQPNQEKTLTDDMVKSVEDQIIPLSEFKAPESAGTASTAENSAPTLENAEHIHEDETVKHNDENSAPAQQSHINQPNSLNEDQRRAIDDMMNFFNFAGLHKTPVEHQRSKRSFNNDLKILALTRKFQRMKRSIDNASYVHKLARTMVEYLNEHDMIVKNRILKDVLAAEQEIENDKHFIYLQASITIPCDKEHCKEKESAHKICNCVIDCSNKTFPQILNTFCYDDEKTILSRKLQTVPFDDPILVKLAKRALMKIESESTKDNAMRVLKILDATTQKTSGRLTRISMLLSYTNCKKSLDFNKRLNCSTVEDLGSEICDVTIHERINKKKEMKINYICNERGIHENFVDTEHPKKKNKNLNDPEIQNMVQEALQYLEKESNINKKQKLVSIKSVSTKVVAGLVTDVAFTVGYSDCRNDENVDVNTCQLLPNEAIRECTAQVWDRAWLENGRQVNVKCENGPIVIPVEVEDKRIPKKHARLGSQTERDPDDIKYKQLAEESLLKYLDSVHISLNEKLVQVSRVTTQVVSGLVTEIDFDVYPTNGDTFDCHSKIWDQPLLKKKDITVDCNMFNQKLRAKRGMAGALREADASDPKYSVLAEESLQKYLQTSGETLTERKIEVTKVTVQVVAGTMTKIVFNVRSKNRDFFICDSEVWERPWLKSKEITVNCNMNNKQTRIKRQLFGGETEKEPSDPKYSVLAEESLQKYLQTSGVILDERKIEVTKVTTKVVSGSKSRIDFTVRPSNGDSFTCHSEVWEQAWLKKKEITVNCNLNDKLTRVKRQLGGYKEQDANDPKYKKLAEESLEKYLKSITGGPLQLKQLVVSKVSTQVVAGTITRIDFDVYPANGDSIKCHSEVWEQPWLNKKNINVNCSLSDQQTRKKRGLISDGIGDGDLSDPNERFRVKRQIPGGQTEQDPSKPQYSALAEESLQKYLQTSGVILDERKIEVTKVTTQVVSGSKTRIDFIVRPSNGDSFTCHSEVWEQAWLKKKEITVNCNMNDKQTRVKRQIPGGQTEQDPSKPEYSALAEESLQKYLQTSGVILDERKIEVTKVTIQVVSGSKTRIDFNVRPSNGDSFTCHSEVWEQAWLKKKEITVNCNMNDKRTKVKRQVFGGHTEQDPSKPEYSALAEESLKKYLQTSGVILDERKIEVTKVTTQVVSGSKTRIDFIVRPSNGDSFTCHSEVWEQAWLKKKEITVNCNMNDKQTRVKRQIPGGQTEQDPSKPEYSSLAEESLKKYLQTSGVILDERKIEVTKVTTQVVSGSKTRIDFNVRPSNGDSFTCHSEVWEQAWLKKTEITVNCNMNDKQTTVKRQIPGGQTEQDPSKPEYSVLAEESLKKYLQTSGGTFTEKQIKVTRVTTQIVEGSMTRIDFTVRPTNGDLLACHSEVWERPWINKKDITVDCGFGDQLNRNKREMIGGGLIDADLTDQKYRVLAEESLQKYLHTYGGNMAGNKIEITKVTVQVLDGVLTRLEFDVLPANGDSFSCRSEVLEQIWLHKKEINVNCYIEKRKKREIAGKSRKRGSPQKEDSSKPEYKDLAEQSLQKYLKLQNSKTRHDVLEVKRVTSQVVAGRLYEIDFTAAPTTCSKNTVNHSECRTKNETLLFCHSKIWSRVWLKSNQIEVICNTDTDESLTDNIFDEDEKKRSIGVEAHEEPQRKDITKIINYVLNKDKPVGSLQDKLKTKTLIDEFNKGKPVGSHGDKLNYKEHRDLAQEAVLKFERLSNSKYMHKISQIHRVSEQVSEGILTTIEFSMSPTECFIGDALNVDDCKIKEPKVEFLCLSTIWERSWIYLKDIKVSCKNLKARHVQPTEWDDEIPGARQIEREKRQLRGEDDDYIDDDLTFYYADRAIKEINDRSQSHNLQKLITVHAIDDTNQMGARMIRMYIETAVTFCLRPQAGVELSDCEEIDGLNRKLCLVRLWPHPDDELVVQHVAVVCDDDSDFSSVTGLSIPILITASIKEIEKSQNIKFKLVHQGEPNIVPTLSSKHPIKMSFVVASTNCSKDVDVYKHRDICFVDTAKSPTACESMTWLVPNSMEVKDVTVKCFGNTVDRKKRSANINTDKASVDITIGKLVDESIEKLEASSGHRYKQRLLQINTYSTKIQKGRVTTIDFDVGFTSCLKYEYFANISSCEFIEHLPRRHCVSHVFERLWVENGKNIEVICEDDETPLEPHVGLESSEMAMELAKEAVKHIEAKYPHPRRLKVVRIFSLEKQALAGIHYRMKIEVGITDCIALSVKSDCKLTQDSNFNKFCRVNVWIRPWTEHAPNFRVWCDYQESLTTEHHHMLQAEQLFYDFLTTYSPDYVNDYIEMAKRFTIFRANVRKVHELNVHERGTARYAMTQFSDLTYEEFTRKYMGLKPGLKNANNIPLVKAEIPKLRLPDKFDWREHGAVTEVKNQGSCGSCWAFSVTGNIEGQWKLQTGKLLSLSEQELVDCDKLDKGCDGGLPDNAYRAIEELGGLELESDYPYEGEDDKCIFNKTLTKVQISGAVNISSNETEMAKWLVGNGPISIGINANAMQFYVGGISHPWKVLCSPSNLDHGVLIVGFGAKDYPLFHKHLPYWVIKNSWGQQWGEQGYYRVYRGDGTCGVNQMASSAVI